MPGLIFRTLGKTSIVKGMVLLNIRVGSIDRPTMFVVVPSKASYNLLLGRDWIHGVGAIPSTLHQRMILWNGDGEIEEIEPDDSNCQYEQLRVDFKMYNPRMKPLSVDVDIFDPKSIERCQIGYNGFHIMPKAEAGSALKETQAMNIESQMVRPSAYLADREGCAVEGALYDCIYDLGPLGFEKKFTNNVKKVEVQDPLEEIDIGYRGQACSTYLSKLLSDDFKKELTKLLKEYKDCFAWDYDEIPRLNRDLVEHTLPMKANIRPVKQPSRQFAIEVVLKIKEEIERLLKAKFIRTVRYVNWISNILSVMKKNGKLRVCIDFRDLINTTPKDEYLC